MLQSSIKNGEVWVTVMWSEQTLDTGQSRGHIDTTCSYTNTLHMLSESSLSNTHILWQPQFIWRIIHRAHIHAFFCFVFCFL